MTGETVTRLRPVQTGTDRYGNPIYSTSPAELDLDGALFAPGGTQEPAQPGRTPVIAEPSLYFPHTRPDLTAQDQIRVRGAVYDITGAPGDWRSGYGSTLGGLVVQLKKVDG